MKQPETKQKQFNYYLYLTSLTLALLSLSLAASIKWNNAGAVITPLIFFINSYFFTMVRKKRGTYSNEEKIYTLVSTSISIWAFLHCLLYVYPDLTINLISIMNKIGFNIQSHRLNYEVFSFFTANLFFLIVSIREMGKINGITRSIYLVGIVFTAYIVLNYLLLYSNLLTISENESSFSVNKIKNLI